MRLRDRAEWRTLGLILVCYLSIGLLLTNPMGLPLWVQILALIPLVTLHSSLQHECMHGHPFVYQRLNDALVWTPLGLFLPYSRFKAAHIKHHKSNQIGDPFEDPESGYLDPDVWARKPRWMQQIFEVNNTLSGRMLLGPAISLIGFVRYEFRSSDRQVLSAWSIHVVAVILICTAVILWSKMPLWGYLTSCYFGYSLLMVRTFLEHQAHTSRQARTVIVEDKGIFSYLFLNNNLHVVHHAYPALAWYQLPPFFHRNRDRFLAMNKGYYFKNYREIFKRFAFSKKEPVFYPLATLSEAKGYRSDE